MSTNQMVIIGGGLTGMLLSIYLARRGYQVTVYEQRNEEQLLSDKHYELGRSLSLDLSRRGFLALKDIDLLQPVLDEVVPMRKRVIHLPDNQVSVPYAASSEHYISTVSRFRLHNLLVGKASEYPEIQIKFGYQFQDYDIASKTLHFCDNQNKHSHSIKSDIVLACDGANSRARAFVEKTTESTFSRTRFPLHYKVLFIPKDRAANLDFEAMHMWPDKNAMLVAQPNHDGSFASALMLPIEGEVSFKQLDGKSNNEIVAFFDDHFQDLIHLAPDLANEIKNNPLGSFTAIRGDTWQVNQAFLLLGDAVHAMPPFLGQGVNSCFEDCYLLNKYLDLFDDDWSFVIPHFERNRKQDAESITRMSLENYPELTNDDWQYFVFEREVEYFIMKEFQPFYTSFHNLICFDHVPYRYADNIRSLQRNLISKVSKKLIEQQLPLTKENVADDFLAYLEKKKVIDTI